jgi:hypothetical protein
MRLTRRYAAALVTGLLLLTACNGDDNEPAPDPPPIGGDEDEDDEDDEDNEAVEDEDEEPYAVPDEIDEAYAEEVINVLLEIDTEVLKIALEQDQGELLDPQAVDRVHAIADGRQRDSFLESLQRYIDDPSTAQGLLPVDEMGVSRFEARGVLHAEPERCMLVVGWWDRTEIATDPPEMDSLVSLSRLDRDVTSLERNPTPWVIREISPMLINDEPVPEERWDDIDFGDDPDRTCEDR